MDDTDTGGDTDTGDSADAGDDAGDQGVPLGYGDPCTQGGGECAGLEADYCLGDATQGMCTIQGCTPGGCPTGATCCDCA